MATYERSRPESRRTARASEGEVERGEYSKGVRKIKSLEERPPEWGVTMGTRGAYKGEMLKRKDVTKCSSGENPLRGGKQVMPWMKKPV